MRILIIKKVDFKQQTIKLDKGDKIIMYTDGLTEALNPANELYDEEHLVNCLNRSDKNLSVEELLAFVRADVNTHVNGAARSDDITIMRDELESCVLSHSSLFSILLFLIDLTGRCYRGSGLRRDWYDYQRELRRQWRRYRRPDDYVYGR